MATTKNTALTAPGSVSQREVRLPRLSSIIDDEAVTRSIIGFVKYRFELKGLSGGMHIAGSRYEDYRFVSRAAADAACKIAEGIARMLTDFGVDDYDRYCAFDLNRCAAACEAVEGSVTVAGISRARVRELEERQACGEFI